MKKIQLFAIILMTFPTMVFCQSKPSDHIHFEKKLNWDETIRKATKERKLILIDFYATWCTPCKEMDASVFTDPDLIKFIDSNFIAIKVQIDSTGQDTEDVVKWRHDAKLLSKKYSIRSLPSFLFFSPNGTVLHKSTGFKTAKQFRMVAEEAFTPSTQYYTILRKYHNRSLGTDSLPVLAKLALGNNDLESASDIFRKYLVNHLDTLPQSELLKKENLDFLNSFKDMIIGSDNIFLLARDHPDLFKTVGSNWTSTFVYNVIYREDIIPLIRSSDLSSSDVDWEKAKNSIASKHGIEWAQRAVLKAKPPYYRSKKNYSKYSMAVNDLVEYLDKANKISALGLNNYAWDIFLYSDNRDYLKNALKWINKACALDSNYKESIFAIGYLDTKANILYKLGRVDEAIALEKKAKAVDPKGEGFPEVLSKMLMNKITWDRKEF